MLPNLPEPPSRDDPVNFSVRADEFLGALPAWTDAANALEQSLQLVATTGTSTTALTVGTGSKTLTSQAGKAWAIGAWVYLVYAPDLNNLMYGQITAYNSTTGSLTVNVTSASGGGSLGAWVIGLAVPTPGSMSFSGDVSVHGSVGLSVNAAGVGGSIIRPGDSTHSGFVLFNMEDGSVAGYIGNASTTTIDMDSEGGRYFKFNQAPRSNVDASDANALVRKSQMDTATQQATTSVRGTSQLASPSDVQAGLSGTLAVTPASMQAGKIVQSASVATTSGTAFDFTGIPSWAKRITLTFKGVSLSGSSDINVRQGTSSGYVSTGYSGFQGYVVNDGNANTTGSTTGIAIIGGNPSTTVHGVMTIVMHDAATNAWVGSHTAGTVGGTAVVFGGGSIALSGALDRIRLTTANGTDTFDAGSVNITWE